MFVGKIIWGYSSKVEHETVNLQAWVRFPLSPQNIGLWCNGSTADFGSASLGSNPGSPTNKEPRFWLLFLYINLFKHLNDDKTRTI